MIFQEIPLFAFSQEKAFQDLQSFFLHLMGMLLKLADITLGISPV